MIDKEVISLGFNVKTTPFSYENSIISLPQQHTIEESACATLLTIDGNATKMTGFLTTLIEGIAQCCVFPFTKATIAIQLFDTLIPVITLLPGRANKLLLQIDQQTLYTIGRTSFVIRDAQHNHDVAFSTEVERAACALKQQQKTEAPKDMPTILQQHYDFSRLTPFITTWSIAYMPREKALNFLTIIEDCCIFLSTSFKTFVKIPSLALHSGLKGANGFFDTATQTIGLYYKYDRPAQMKLAFFHEYGHLIDLHQKHDEVYAYKRQQLYEQLQASKTLQQISSNTQLPEDYRKYLLSIEEVIARLFEGYAFYKMTGNVSTKEFAFTLPEFLLYEELFTN